MRLQKHSVHAWLCFFWLFRISRLRRYWRSAWWLSFARFKIRKYFYANDFSCSRHLVSFKKKWKERKKNSLAGDVIYDMHHRTCCRSTWCSPHTRTHADSVRYTNRSDSNGNTYTIVTYIIVSLSRKKKCLARWNHVRRNKPVHMSR